MQFLESSLYIYYSYIDYDDIANINIQACVGMAVLPSWTQEHPFLLVQL